LTFNIAWQTNAVIITSCGAKSTRKILRMSQKQENLFSDLPSRIITTTCHMPCSSNWPATITGLKTLAGFRNPIIPLTNTIYGTHHKDATCATHMIYGTHHKDATCATHMWKQPWRFNLHEVRAPFCTVSV
jgi:hypothetical protein